MGSRIGTYNASENKALDDLQKILNKYDLERLIRMGAPYDEYSSEAEQILYRISNVDGSVSIEDVAGIAEGVFNDYFSTTTRKRRYDPTEIIFMSYDVWLIIEEMK